MNITQLEYFISAVRCKSYAEAGRQLHITPQAVSKAVLALEGELNVALFEKDGKGVRPTALGYEVASRAQLVLDDLADLRAYASSHSAEPSQSGSLTVAIASQYYRGSLYRPEDFTEFAEQFPHIKLKTIWDSNEFCLSALASGVAQAAIVSGKPRGSRLQSVKLFSFTPSVLCAPTSPLAYKQAVSLGDLAQVPLAYPADMDRFFHELVTEVRAQNTGAAPQFVTVDPSPEAYRRFLNAGGALFIIKNARAKRIVPEAVEKPLVSGSVFSIPVYFVFPATGSPRCLAHLEDYLIETADHVAQQL